MRFTDVLGLALTALWQRKLRTALTALGVLFGTLVLVASLSLGRGVQDTIVREYSRHNELRHVDVRPGYGRAEDVPEEEVRVEGVVHPARRQRLHDALVARWQRRNPAGPQVRLTPRRIEDLRQLNGVESVRPNIQLYGRAILGKRSEEAAVAPA